jgi:hypothetical protein
LIEAFLIWGGFSDDNCSVTAIHYFLHNAQCLDGCLVYVNWYGIMI